MSIGRCIRPCFHDIKHAFDFSGSFFLDFLERYGLMHVKRVSKIYRF